MIVLLATLFLTLVWQLVKIICTNCQKHQQLILAQQQLQSCALQIGTLAAMQEKNHNLLDFYNALGHSIAALHIQLQVAQKLWQINPTQAQQSLSEAYQLTSSLMHEVRRTVKSMDRDSCK